MTYCIIYSRLCGFYIDIGVQNGSMLRLIRVYWLSSATFCNLLFEVANCYSNSYGVRS